MRSFRQLSLRSYSLSQPRRSIATAPVTPARLERIALFLNNLADCPPSEYEKLLKDLQYVPSEWSKYVHESNEHYTRNLVSSKDFTYDLILLVWKAGQKSAIHDHSGSGCWMRILTGSLTERRYSEVPGASPKLISDRAFGAPSTLYVDNTAGVHQVENTGTETAMSLHLYSPPITDCRVWMDGIDKQPSVFRSNFYSMFGVRVPQHFLKPSPTATLGGKFWPLKKGASGAKKSS